jgi:hypothetical protein
VYGVRCRVQFVGCSSYGGGCWSEGVGCKVYSVTCKVYDRVFETKSLSLIGYVCHVNGPVAQYI